MIKRFNPDFSLSISHELAYMRETPEGGYVAHGDYATLFSELELVKAERDALAVENAALLEVIGELRRQAVYGRRNSHNCGPFQYSDLCESIIESAKVETPATSAALAAIRAQGVDAAIAHLLNKFEGTGQIGVPVMALESLAKQMREAK
jgi:hypothetical protein